jgi:hypothetical protein
VQPQHGNACERYPAGRPAHAAAGNAASVRHAGCHRNQKKGGPFSALPLATAVIDPPKWSEADSESEFKGARIQVVSVSFELAPIARVVQDIACWASSTDGYEGKNCDRLEITNEAFTRSPKPTKATFRPSLFRET